MEDIPGPFEVIVFPGTYREFAPVLKENRALLVVGKVSIREDEAPKVIAERFEDLEQNDAYRSVLRKNFNPGDEQPDSNGPASRGSISNPVNSEAEGRPDPGTTDIEHRDVSSIDEVSERQNGTDGKGRKLAICYHGAEGDRGYLRILATLGYFRGTVPVVIYFSGKKKTIGLSDSYAVELTDDILREITDLCGRDNVIVL